MKFNEAFEGAIREVGTTKTRVSLDAGKRNVSALLMLLKRNNPKVDQLLPYLEAAGYTLVLAPSNKVKFLSDDYFVVDEPGTEAE